MKDYKGNDVTDAFKYSPIKSATLYVPAASVEAYKAVEPWKNFKEIKSLTGEDIPEEPEVKKCATPTIALIDGKLKFSCETDGVEYVSEITCSDVKKHYETEIPLACTYHVSVYATKEGWENSDVVTKDIELSLPKLKSSISLAFYKIVRSISLFAFQR